MAGELIRKYRRYSEAEKRSIVAECGVPGASVARVARRNEVNANQVYQWRRRLLGGSTSAVWLPVTADLQTPPISSGTGTLDIVLASGHRLQLSGCVDSTALEICLRRLLA